MMPDPETEASPDVLPPLANLAMAALWLLLFGGRWIGGNLLLATGALTPAQLAVWDETLLLRIYLVLFAITVLVLALRFVRRGQATASHSTQPAAQSEAVSAPRAGQEREDS